MNYACLLSVGTAAVAATLLSSVPARAATELPQNTEKFGGVRQEAKTTTSCVNTKDCLVFFNQAVGANGIQIQKVSCNFYTDSSPNSLQVLGAELLRYSADEKTQFGQGQQLTIPYANGYSATFGQYQFLADILWGIPAGWRPTVHIWFNNAVTVVSITCTISGPAPA